MEAWDIQEYHLETHNLLYSVIFGELETGFVDIGYQVVGEFTRLEDQRNNTEIEPCYTIFDGNSVVFFDVLEPGDITSEEIDRISSYNQIGLEAVENHIDNVEVSDPDLDHNDIENFDHCVICREEQLTQQGSGTAEQRQRLEQLEREACIASVENGESLIKSSGSIRADNLDNILQRGVSVPNNVSHTIHLPRRVQPESLAVAICEEIVLGSDLRDGGVELEYADIRKHFGRSISYDKLDDVFAYLRNKGACRKRDESFAFTKYDLDDIMGIRSEVEDTSVQDHLEGRNETGEQRTLDEAYGQE
ncbi:hypothetical protein [Haloarcula pellucida]|uniref:Uncharacterized protein n=1 Tax=Haloarcula pellucida TaxID=1427151 RepID=A0A830GUK9_9EURY|nr:hypothetical protein [Halomicroarcula pellucida]MBX0349417.1 hypothetical protein [Halomicroarcula pellucida]GGO03032.1 hypothetical protein GCM10009030_38280 [Halomicroarcula pellucida]